MRTMSVITSTNIDGSIVMKHLLERIAVVAVSLLLLAIISAAKRHDSTAKLNRYSSHALTK